MRTVFLSILLLFCMSVCNAQIAPPKQTDTLIISSVKYNYADINQDNWPCEIIYKSTKDIRIGNQTFNIISADKFMGVVYFTVYDVKDPQKKEYELKFEENNKGMHMLSFSGYEFTCFKKGYMPQMEDADETIEVPGYGGPSVKSYTLDGRKAVNLKIPAYRCYGEGEVTVIISVNPAGQVIKADVKEDVSSDDECLRNFAVRAARLSRFSSDHDAQDITLGEIVYSFKAEANVSSGYMTYSMPNAKVPGRSVNGTLPCPSYPVQASGIVVVEIWVDNYGNVQKAVAGVEGTTASDKNLWQAARKAALGANFNMSADAPALQKGTITYTFRLR